jgi:hypothetical protein
MEFIKICDVSYLENSDESKNVDFGSDKIDNWIQKIGEQELSIDSPIGCIYIAGKSSIAGYQNGYMGDDWKDSWIVIAKYIDDPIIFDMDTNEVLSALHGAGEWNPYYICQGLEDFEKVLVIMCKTCQEYNNDIQDDDCELLEDFIHSLKNNLSESLDDKTAEGFLKLITT